VKNPAGTCARELTHRGDAIPRIDRQHLFGIRTTPSPLNPVSDLTLQQRDSLLVAACRSEAKLHTARPWYKSGTARWEAARRLFVWIERLPQFDFVAVGIVYPSEAAVAFVLALRVDVDAFFR
jgi:hypothetical protein